MEADLEYQRQRSRSRVWISVTLLMLIVCLAVSSYAASVCHSLGVNNQYRTIWGVATILVVGLFPSFFFKRKYLFTCLILAGTMILPLNYIFVEAPLRQEVKKHKPKPVAKTKDSATILKKRTMPEAVDLGLSVLWADRNFGAEKPEENGSYHQHIYLGRSKMQIKYHRFGGKYVADTLLDYEDLPLEQISGTKYDRVYCVLGNGWRQPTIREVLPIYPFGTFVRQRYNFFRFFLHIFGKSSYFCINIDKRNG